MDFKAKLKDVPEEHGVYMMLDAEGGIIYVGKAKNLRARLKQYFHHGAYADRLRPPNGRARPYTLCGSIFSPASLRA